MKKDNLKSLRDMDLNEVSLLYKNIFKEILPEDSFKSIIDIYQAKYNKFLEYKFKNYTSPTAMGRDQNAYGRNIIYGWLIEELILLSLLENHHISKAEFFGNDKEHDFIYDHENSKITINGTKTTDPDILVTLKDDTKFLIEVKTGAKNIFSIKKGNVNSLIKSTADYDYLSLILMIDLVQGLYEIKDLNYFLNQTPFPNANMEGQLCYDFPSPKHPIEEIKNINFKNFLDLSIFENMEIKKFRLLKMSLEKNNKLVSKIIKDKIKLEKLQEEKDLSIKDFENKIGLIISKNNLVLKSWIEIEDML